MDMEESEILVPEIISVPKTENSILENPSEPRPIGIYRECLSYFLFVVKAGEFFIRCKKVRHLFAWLD